MDITLTRIIDELHIQKKYKIELTNHLGLVNSTFGNWMSGRNQSYKKYLHAIADFLGVSVEYLRGETDQKRKALINNDEELTDLLEEIKDREEIRALFKISAKATKEDIEKTIRILEALKGENDGTNCPGHICTPFKTAV